MDKYEIIKNIIIPILASIIGGCFTVGGVYLTIKYEKQKEKAEKLLSYKPLIYRLDPMQKYEYKNAVDFKLSDSDIEESWELWGIIKNTDNAILIIDGVVVNGKKYKPKFGNVVDKNQIFNLYVYVSEVINESDEVILIVKDIMDNIYKYKLDIKSDDENSEIIGLDEIVGKWGDSVVIKQSNNRF